MKKLLAMLLVLVLCSATALAAEWGEGRSPSKPYAGSPEVDLSQQIGYMMFYPNAKMDLQGGGKTLEIYLPRDDVEAGEGTLYLATEEGEVWRTVFNNTESVVKRDMSEYELNSLLWGSGVCFEVTLPKSLELGKTYFVNLDKGCIVANGGEVVNPTIGGTDAWRFSVTGDFGVSLVEYRRPIASEDEQPAEGEVEYENEIATPQPDDIVRMDVVLGGDATMAVLYANHNSVGFDQTMIEASGEITGTVLTEDPSFGLVFLDAEGNELMNIEF